MNFICVGTTGNQWLGLQFQLPSGIQAPFYFPVTEDVNFRVDKIDKGEDQWIFSNPHYIVVARVV